MKNMKKSPNWETFMNEFFKRSSYIQWHDGIDPSVLLKLSKEELAEAEDLLIDSVKNGGMWPTVGLATIKSEKAIPVLKEKLKTSKGILKIRIADALEKIEGTRDYLRILIEELRENPSPYDRLEATMNLGDYPELFKKENRDSIYYISISDKINKSTYQWQF